MPKLAINGGNPEVAKQYHQFIHPIISKQIVELMNDLHFQDSVSSFEGNGVVAEVERTFGQIVGAKNALATNSGTSALLTMYYALGLGPGDEVIVPAYTFFATAMPLFSLGCRPVLADCLDNGNIDPSDIRRRITQATRAIVITHMWGIPCDMDEILQIASEFNLPVLEDGSHAHGATYRGDTVGNLGTAAAWSLGAKKIVTGGQGGMFQSSNDEIFQRGCLLGSANDKKLKRITLPHLQPYAITGTGLNLRMHPFAAILINEQLIGLPQQLEHRREVARYMIKELKSVPGISFPRIPDAADPSWYAFIILYDSTTMKDVSKEDFVKALTAEGAIGADIPASTCPMTRFQCFRDGHISFGFPIDHPVHFEDEFINAERFHLQSIKLPVWYGPNRMGYAKAYANAILKVVENIEELR